MHLQTLAITINQSLIGKVRLLLTMLHHTVCTRTRFFTKKGSGTFLFIGGLRQQQNGLAQQDGGASTQQVPAETLLGTVNRNEQRQDIITAMVSCLLCYMVRLGVIAAYVHTGESLYTSGKV